MAVTKNLVLGGSGLIGSSLCNHLRQLGQEVINIDLLNGPEQDLRTMDLTPYSNVDYVWFLAWDVGGAKYLTAEKNLINILHNNTLLCERVFSFLEQTQIPFLFATTQLADPNNTYGITKILGQEWTKLLGGKLARFWNVYGWEEPGERSHVIPDLVIQGLREKHISLMTNGEEERQFIFVDDCAKNLVKIRESHETDVDLTAGRWYPIKEVAQIIAQKTGATLTLGPKMGYHNKLEPVKLPSFITADVGLDEGIDQIMQKATEYLAVKK